MIYLDNSSTTKQFSEVTRLMADVAENNFGNPSSLHQLGYESSNVLRKAIAQIDACFPSGGRTIVTSCGTESDNMALVSGSAKLKRQGRKIITTAVEHPAVLRTVERLKEEGWDIVLLPVDKEGTSSIEALEAELDENTVLVSMMTVNNETGTIQPVKKACTMVHNFAKEHGTRIFFHTDGVQAFGKIDLRNSDFDLISISAHKFHGPKGIGALYMKNGVNLPPFIMGGGQERGFRSGTENVPGIAGMGLAAQMSCTDMDEKNKKLSEVNNYLYNGLKANIKDIFINGPETIGTSLDEPGSRCPSLLNISFEGVRGEVLLHTLEQDEIYVSTGSACHSNNTGDSHVLTAIGRKHKEIEGAVRFSLGQFNTVEEMDIAIDRTAKAVERFRRLGSFR